jgi:hypothetical protein
VQPLAVLVTLDECFNVFLKILQALKNSNLDFFPFQSSHEAFTARIIEGSPWPAYAGEHAAFLQKTSVVA